MEPDPCRFLPVAATVEAESAGCFLPAENALPAQLLLRVSGACLGISIVFSRTMAQKKAASAPVLLQERAQRAIVASINRTSIVSEELAEVKSSIVEACKKRQEK